MVDQERWAEIRRLRHSEQVSISEIGRRLDLDRKTVWRSLRQETWQPRITEHRWRRRCRRLMLTVCEPGRRRFSTPHGFCTRNCGRVLGILAVTRP